MAIRLARGPSDDVTEHVMAALHRYQDDHPRAEIDVYRLNRVSVRVRVVDPDWAGQPRPQRHQTVWRYLDALSDDDQSDVSTLLLLTPHEARRSFANFEFDDPVASELP